MSDLELGGLKNLSDGRLGRDVPSGRVLVPEHVWQEGDTIKWQRGPGDNFVKVSRNTLDDFVKLADAGANSIVKFAQTWGVLAISKDWVQKPDHRLVLEKGGGDPIDAWRYLSRRARAVLRVAAALNQDKLGDLSDWYEFGMVLRRRGLSTEIWDKLKETLERPLYGLSYSIFALDDNPLARARDSVADEIGHWLDAWKHESRTGLSDFRLGWSDSNGRWELQIDYHGLLFAAIAVQLLLVVASADSLYSCSGCGTPYIRPRGRKRPKMGWANYCENCTNNGVAQRKAVENYREKKQEAIRLHVEGLPNGEIARRLGSKASSVQNWLKKGTKSQAKARK